MERICPLLGLATDQRTVVDGYDPEHRCLALETPATLERTRQVQLCLTEAHVRCERLATARHRPRATGAASRAALDVAFLSTRLTLEPDTAWRTLGSGRLAGRARGVVIIGATGAVAAVAVVMAANAGLFSAVPASPSPSVVPTSSIAASPTNSVAPSESAAATTAASPTPAVTAAPTPAATARTYVVQLGDTLGVIAAQFGTTVSAIQQANGLGSSTIINVGQVLIIP
jgi:LysM repeat protein